MQSQDFSKFQPLKPRYLEVVDKMLAEDIARLMALIPLEENVTVTEPIVKGNLMSRIAQHSLFSFSIK